MHVCTVYRSGSWSLSVIHRRLFIAADSENKLKHSKFNLAESIIHRLQFTAIHTFYLIKVF